MLGLLIGWWSMCAIRYLCLPDVLAIWRKLRQQFAKVEKIKLSFMTAGACNDGDGKGTTSVDVNCVVLKCENPPCSLRIRHCDYCTESDAGSGSHYKGKTSMRIVGGSNVRAMGHLIF